MNRRRPTNVWMWGLCAAWLFGGGIGCNLIPGAGLTIPILANIQWEQRGEEPNFTIRFNATNAVSDTSKVKQINWVFGDGSGFETGGVQIDHRYTATGTYDVKAYVFDDNGFVATVNTRVTVNVPSLASGPNPANNATNVPIAQILSWTPGSGATRSLLYLSTSLSAVQSALPGALQGELSISSFTPTSLAGGTDYFWRVDSKTASQTVAGPVWTFKTAAAPGPITNATPADAAVDVALTAKLSWTAGTGGTSRDVYFGTDFNAVSNATTTSAEFKGNQSTTMFDPTGDLENNKAYYWRVDEIGLGGKSKGAVLAFKSAALPGKITVPSPADNATGVAVDAMLSWTAGTTATSHDVYFGTTRDAVTTATKTGNLFRGNQQATTFKPSLGANVSFFWRIDEVGPGGTTKGDTLEFKTALAPAVATEFDPKDDEIEISLTPTLKWKAGANVVNHLVYFGESSSAVSGATSEDVSGILKATLDLGVTQYEPGATTALAENKEYFWRIDERGPGGTARGPVLSFVTRDPIRATDPRPTNGEKMVPLSKMLSWTAGVQNGATPLSHDVYLAKTEAAVNTATNATAGVFQGNFPGGTLAFNPVTLDANTDYFWRIDERYDTTDPNVTTEVAKGKVWRFTTIQGPAAQATSPQPADGAVDVDKNADLAWTAGIGTTSHAVYFGTVLLQVQTATTATTGIYKGTFPNTGFALPELAANTDYYWRIDEINDAGTTAGSIWHFKTLAAPAQITDPIPADAATGQAVAITLRWTAPTSAASYDVYFGTDQTAVTNANTGSAVFRGNQTAVQFTPSGVLQNTTYYWRIDPKNAAGTTNGQVLSFTTGLVPDKAAGFIPADNAAGISISPTLSWTAGANAVTHDVYFGTDQNAVTTATPGAGQGVFRGNQSGVTYSPSGVTADTQYFWRIDEVAPGGTKKGDVLRFRTAAPPTQASLVAGSGDGPANGGVGLKLRPILQWTSGTGTGTITHDVYFGTSQSGVTNATRISTEFKQNQGTNTYSPGSVAALIANTRYFWRIDEVDSLGGTTKGVVWQFDTTPATRFLVLDPADRPVNSPTQVTIQAVDASNNVVTSFNDDVTLNVTGGASGGGLVDIVNGVGSMMVNSTTPQSVLLQLSDGQATGLNITSAQSVIFWGPVANFAVEAAGGGLIGAQTVGVAFNIRVTARDSANQTVQDYTGTVDLTSPTTFFGGPTLTTGPLSGGILASQPISFTASAAQTTLTATQTGGAAMGTSNGFKVDP